MNKRLPVIGINCDYIKSKSGNLRQRQLRARLQLQAPYYQAIFEAGGLPMVIPPADNPEVLSAYLAMVDGLLFTGGADYPPAYYGESPHPLTEPCDSLRAQSDLLLMRLVLEKSLPVLGICLGTQLLNISRGGKLIQDLTTDIQHRAASSTEDAYHEVEIMADSLLASVLTLGRHRVNSAHHQAVHPNHLGKGLRITALAEDGTVEALELADHQERFFICLQWHPERIRDQEQKRKIFTAFIQACQK